MKSWIIPCFTLCLTQGHAAPDTPLSGECPQPASLLPKQQICADNPELALFARGCLSRLRQRIRDESGRAAERLREEQLRWASRQTGMAANSVSDYRLSASSLGAMIEETRQTLVILNGYRDSLIFPSSWIHLAGSPEAFSASLEHNHCFREPARAVERAIGEAQGQLRELQAAETESFERSAASGRLVGSLASPGRKPAANTRRAAGAGVDASKHAHRESTITGRIEPGGRE